MYKPVKHAQLAHQSNSYITFMTTFLPQATSHTLTVSQLNKLSNQLLSSQLFNIKVIGEISNLSTPSSGHWYFSLKDANAHVRCAMFKHQQKKTSVKPKEGLSVVIKAQVSIYEPRGDYQLIVEAIEAAGNGQLQQAYEALKTKLAEEGLFANHHKKSIPKLPTTIGIITSPTGAALHDILTVLKRRFAAIPIIIYPVSVQGEKAKTEIALAITQANDSPLCDVLILGRGGGSLEDLWAFNEEIVARAIFASEIPIIAAIGHETDITIADFIADLRAPTPSAAAELASPDSQEWFNQFEYHHNRLKNAMVQHIKHQQNRTNWLTKRLEQQHPQQTLSRNCQHLDDLETRLKQAICHNINALSHAYDRKKIRLQHLSPTEKIQLYRHQVSHLHHYLPTLILTKLQQLQQEIQRNSQTLQAISPLATLERGYALVLNPLSGEIIRSVKQLTIGERIETRVGDGQLVSTITHIDNS
jgi:exodeoxyribonuclease VII large subunit